MVVLMALAPMMAQTAVVVDNDVVDGVADDAADDVADGAAGDVADDVAVNMKNLVMFDCNI